MKNNHWEALGFFFVGAVILIFAYLHPVNDKLDAILAIPAITAGTFALIVGFLCLIDWRKHEHINVID